MNDVQRWIGLIEEAVRSGLAAGDDQAADLARILIGAPPVTATSTSAPLDRRRPVIAAYLAYIDALARGVASPPDSPPGGAGLAARVFHQLANIAIDRRESDAMRSLISLHDGQTFSVRSAEDQLEAWWFGELATLHGATSYALLSGDPTAWDVVKHATLFHHAETQPDHATADPWAIHAFIFNPATRDLAESQLNATMIQHAGEPRGVALVLLAEALYLLRHVAKN